MATCEALTFETGKITSLLVLPVAGAKSIADNIKDAKKKSAYNKNRSEYVRIMSQKILAKAAAFEALNTLNDLQARIPMLVEADVRLCQQLIEEA